MASLNHDRRGSGPPLVLLHGLGMDWRSWDPLLDRLAQQREVIAVDLPGHGASPVLDVEPTAYALTDAVQGLLGELGLERPHVAGVSTGGGVALELARRGAVATATAISPIGFWTPAERRWCQESLNNQWRLGPALRPVAPALVRNPVVRTLQFGQVFGKPWRLPPEAALQALDTFLSTQGFEATNAAFDHYVFTRGEELRDVPVTVLWGDHDWLLLPREGRRVPRAIPHARLVWLHGCGHIPFYDDPDAVVGALTEASARA
jgi:pimeloyl-ACP methyl ester carboxylesterase